MTITKTLKTKLVLGILAAAVSLSLVIGGTLMLFTAQSGEATNTVTLGSAEIALQESDVAIADEEEGQDTYKTVIGDFDGIKFGDKIPGDVLTKRPRVVNTGNVPVYVYVEGTLVVKGADGAPVSFENFDITSFDFEDIDENSPAIDQIASILASVAGADMGGGWMATAMTPGENGLTGTWFYGTDESTLTPLEAAGAENDADKTSDIFTTITIPTYVGNALSDYEISLKLKAYAVQSANNPNATLGSITALFTPAE
jgi:predicted ribosomally synthesized peptide with SipW-like signal peptide